MRVEFFGRVEKEGRGRGVDGLSVRVERLGGESHWRERIVGGREGGDMVVDCGVNEEEEECEGSIEGMK